MAASGNVMITFSNVDLLDLIMKADGGPDINDLRNQFSRIRNARLFHSAWGVEEEGEHPAMVPGTMVGRFGSKANAQFSKLVRDHLTATKQEHTPENFIAGAKTIPLTCSACSGKGRVGNVHNAKTYRCARCAGKGFQNYEDNQRNMAYNNSEGVKNGALPYDHHEPYDQNILSVLPPTNGNKIDWHSTNGNEATWKVHDISQKPDHKAAWLANGGKPKATRAERSAANKAAFAAQRAKEKEAKAAAAGQKPAAAPVAAPAPKKAAPAPKKAAPAPAPQSALAAALAMRKSSLKFDLVKGGLGVKMADEETSTPEDRDPSRGATTVQNVAPINTDPVMHDKVQVLGEEDPSIFDGDQPKRVVPTEPKMLKLVKSEFDGIVPDDNNVRVSLGSDMQKSLSLGLSLEDRRSLVTRALDERWPPKKDKKTGMTIGGYCYPYAFFDDAVIVQPPRGKEGTVAPPYVKIGYMIENGKAVLGKEETPVRQEWVEVGLKKGLIHGISEDELNTIRKGSKSAPRPSKELIKAEFYNKLATFLIDGATGANRINIRRNYVDRHPNPVPVLAANLQKAIAGEASLEDLGLYQSDIKEAVKAVTGKDLTAPIIKKSDVDTTIYGTDEDVGNLMIVRKGLNARM